MYETKMLSFLANGKTKNVVFPSRCAFCWNPLKFADVLSEKYLGEAKIKSINNGNCRQPLSLKFDKNKKKFEKNGEKETAWQKKIDWVSVVLLFITSSNPLCGYPLVKVPVEKMCSFAPILLRFDYFRQNIWRLSCAQFHFWYIFWD